jgi:hypothetical protein
MITIILFLAYAIIDLYNDMDYTLQSCRSLLNKYKQMEYLNQCIESEVKMRSSALKVIDLLKKGYITDPDIIKKLDEFINDEDIPKMHDMVSGNMKHYAMMVSDIIDRLAALKNGIPSFLMSKYFKEAVNNAINEANELWEKTYNYSNEYETDSNNQVPQLD